MPVSPARRARDAPAPLLAILGPTGVGKTRLAIALGEHWPIEVVSVDSRQVYRRMDIGTAKPTADERRAVRHHLVDVVEPDEAYDAGRFSREAAVAIDAVRSRGRWPVLVGGTGLYYRALVRGLLPRPPADPALRARLRAEARTGGPEALHRRLLALDPASAARLHPRDVQRVSRALEVALQTGRPGDRSGAGAWQEVSTEPRYPIVAIGVTATRPALYAALDARVDRMLAAGLLEEVRALLDAGFSPTLPAMQGIGYRHLLPVVQGASRIQEAVVVMKRDTRRYAKRQWTWFAREPGLAWIEVGAGGIAAAVAEIKKTIERTRLFDYAC
ncbi:MAG TPA: tRNA (adenosine(37)-N6)-dimethylallyltransferase MiaA [Methylomirabilota bacterium]|jgi:tRNA dimethylallyltransferase|nr:tRNA (adenosine(37)-N6)-dimethylallyltransferase MiaA [Methylomirabilota bacterium]